MSEGTAKVSKLTIGLHLGDRFTKGRVIDESGEVIEAFRMRTTEPALSARLASFPPSRVVLEVGTHSPWVRRTVMRLDHEALQLKLGPAAHQALLWWLRKTVSVGHLLEQPAYAGSVPAPPNKALKRTGDLLVPSGFWHTWQLGRAARGMGPRPLQAMSVGQQE